MAKCKSLIFPFIVTSELSFVVEISYKTDLPATGGNGFDGEIDSAK